MPAMTKFSVWENATREFIKEIVTEIRIRSGRFSQEDRDATLKRVTKWIYTTGIEVFSTSQGAAHRNSVNDFLKKHGKRPEITLDDMVENKKIGFQALWVALVNEYAKDNEDLTNHLRDEFETYKRDGLKHTEFFTLQAEITTKLYAAIDRDPGMDNPESKIAMTKDLFSQAEETHPELINSIRDQLLLQDEFIAYMTEKKSRAVAAQASGPTMFAVMGRGVFDRLRGIDSPALEAQPSFRP